MGLTGSSIGREARRRCRISSTSLSSRYHPTDERGATRRRCFWRRPTRMPIVTKNRPQVVEALDQSPQPLLRRLAVEENADEVVISGTVPSYYLKQLAQETIRPHLGCRRLRNRITVREDPFACR